MSTNVHDLAKRFFHKGIEELSDIERRVLERIVERSHVSRRMDHEFEQSLTVGQRVADRVAAFGGSWPFIFIFVGVMICWIIVNSIILLYGKKAFDPYPFILLNLVLSMLAAMQAPVIMMSQNRHAAKDRIDAAHDYEVNLKAELEISGLHDKVDELRERKWEELLAIQQRQLEMLSNLLNERSADAATPGTTSGQSPSAEDKREPLGSS